MNEIVKDYYLAHHGILGQKWGVRRFQNKDGSLTSAGKRRYDQDKPQLPTGAKIDGTNNKPKLPTGTIVDGPSNKPNLSIDPRRKKEEKLFRKIKERRDKKQNDSNENNTMSDRDMKKFLKKNRNQMYNDRSQYSSDFEKTPQYKSLYEPYRKAYDNYFNKSFKNEEDEKKAEKEFSKAEEKLLRAEMEYVGKQMVEKYGNDLALSNLNYSRVKRGEDAVKAYSDMWWIHAE